MIAHRKLLIGVAALAVGISSATVFARDDLSNRKVHLSENISYSDLNLATPQGDHQLESRIRNAATSICERLGAMDRAATPMDQIEQQTSCVNAAIDNARDQVRQAEQTRR